MRQIILAIPLLFLLSGCSTIIKEDENTISFKHIQLTNSTNFEWITYNLLNDLFYPICEDIQEKTKGVMPIYVVDFVNLQSLENQSELGFILSNNVKSQVTQKCNTPIYSLEYAKYLKMGKNGSSMLTRDTNEMAATKMNKNTYALVGSYMITQRQLITYLKMIDLNSGLILKSVTDRATLTEEVQRLESTKRMQQNAQHVRRPFSL